MRKRQIDRLSSALALAEQGFRIFPLSPRSKKPPRDFAWKEEATTDPDRIREWWKADPNFNVGVATGGGTIVVDADTKEGAPGLASLEMLELACGMPKSFRVQTPSGGMHVYLRVDQTHRNRVHSIPDYPGIDIRSDNGYVVGPGSVVDGKPYVAIPGAIEPAGAEVEAALLANAPTHTVADNKAPAVELDLPAHIDLAKEYLVNRAPEAVEGAGGNETTYTVAARCREYGLTQEATLDIMLEHWNETKAFPAWLPAELATVVSNAYRYATGSWGGGMAVAEFDVVDLGEDVGVVSERKGGTRTLPLVKATSFSGKTVPPREWHVAGLIPANTVTLLYGDGGTGKSTLALQCGVATVLNKDWLGTSTTQGGCVYFSAEDDEAEIHRRLADICRAYAADFSDLVGFDILAFAESDGDALLAVQDSNQRTLRPTPLYKALDDYLAKAMPKLLILDTLADVFGGNEIDRAHARGFVGLLRRLAIKHQLACLVLAHPSLSGISSGSGTSGSTGWNNSVRSRLYFKSVTDETTKEDNPDLRVLETAKANYARKGGRIPLRWLDGVFVAMSDSSAAAKAAEKHVEDVFLRMLNEYNIRGTNVSPNASASFAPNKFYKDPSNPNIARKGFEDAMSRLLSRGVIKVMHKGPPSRQVAYLAIAEGHEPIFAAEEMAA